MATYTFLNKNTGEHEEVVLPMSRLDSYKAENPHLSLVILPSNLISGHAVKPAAGFREVLKNIKQANRGSNINTFE